MASTVFYAYRDSPQRRRALAAPVGAPERYLLFGLDQLVARGWTARHDLERAGAAPAWARAGGAALKTALERAGGYGGDFATVLASLRKANRADVVLSTVDTVGIPLMLLERAGRVRPPLVYIAIGLPERLERMRSERMSRLYARSLAGTEAVIAYSEHEADELRRFMTAHGVSTRVEFVPFGVDETAFAPSLTRAAVDVVMAGADPHRDVDLFVGLARDAPERTFRLVTTSDRARGITSVPANLEVEIDVSLEAMKRRLEEARVVALPVLDNTYSGATTVLLQAMALGKPVVVTRTKAIASGYGLVDGDNCRLVEPGDGAGFGRTLAGVLRDEWHAHSLGARARRTVEEGLTWDRYVDRIEHVLSDACEAPQGGRSGRD
ncbi:MAG TPA: glycosyltransferase family 4 protein [Gaiellaceae bacterium]|nr:glycosyltransferase family 4 protein [Gaiellaceae bacterium]